MARDPKSGPAQNNDDDIQAANGGPKPVGFTTYSEVSLKLLDNGYEPVPLYPGKKSPIPTGWTAAIIDEAQVRRWNAEFPDAGVGIRTGDVVGIDIDVLDPDIAHEMGQIVEAKTGATLMRVGLWPKRLYLVKTDGPFAKKSIRKLEILGKGQQFVTFGIHPDTQGPYYWTGETPLDVPASELPLVDEATCVDLLSELAILLPPMGEKQRKSRSGRPSGAGSGPTRDLEGIVIDGRDGWLSTTAFHVVHDAIDAGLPLDAEELAVRVWQHFTGSRISPGRRRTEQPPTISTMPSVRSGISSRSMPLVIFLPGQRVTPSQFTSSRGFRWTRHVLRFPRRLLRSARRQNAGSPLTVWLLPPGSEFVQRSA